MIPLPPGVTLLAIVSILVFLGMAERVLDRMRLSDTAALLLLVALIVAHFLPAIDITPNLSFNLGALVPLGVAIYLLATTTAAERWRGIAAAVITAVLLRITDIVLPVEPGVYPFDIDPVYIVGIIAAIVGYIAGRSRRSAFIGAVLGILLIDLFTVLQVRSMGIPQTIEIGGGGIFDSLVIGGVLAVVLAEIVGEINERIKRGPAKAANRAKEGDNDENQ